MFSHHTQLKWKQNLKSSSSHFGDAASKSSSFQHGVLSFPGIVFQPSRNLQLHCQVWQPLASGGYEHCKCGQPNWKCDGSVKHTHSSKNKCKNLKKKNVNILLNFYINYMLTDILDILDELNNTIKIYLTCLFSCLNVATRTF